MSELQILILSYIQETNLKLDYIWKPSVTKQELQIEKEAFELKYKKLFIY